MGNNKTLSVKMAYLMTAGLFSGFAGWWLYNFFTQSSDATSNVHFVDSYWVTALLGGVIGLTVAKKWGGFKSALGKSISFFSLGLLAQVFGQVVYTYYAYVEKIEAPYPSLGDVGFFGSIILYSIAVLYLAKVSGARLGAAKLVNKLVAVALPAALLVFSYSVFLKDYEVDWSVPTVVLLDFGYPLGQAFYLSLALITYFLSRKLLGGIMKSKVLLLLAALFIQYLADYLFLYRFNREVWYPGDISDATYLLAYFLMTVAILWLGSAARKLGAPVVNTPVASVGTEASNG